MNIKILINKTFRIILLITLCTFLIVWCVYLLNNVSEPIEKTLSTTVGFFGGFATLGAAYIATGVFNSWKDQHNKNLESAILLEYLKTIDMIREVILPYYYGLKVYSIKELNNRNLFNEEKLIEYDSLVILEIFFYYQEKYIDLQLHKWSSSNKYSILKDKNYIINLNNIIDYIRQSFEEISRIAFIKNTHSHSIPITDPNIQKLIDISITNIKQAIKLMDATYKNAITDIRADY